MRMISLQCSWFVLAALGALPLAHFRALAFDDKGRIIAVGSAARSDKQVDDVVYTT